MVKYTSAILATAVLAQAAPAPACTVVTSLVYGEPFWAPNADPSWGIWGGPSSRTTSSSARASTTSASVWSAWDDPSRASTTVRTTTTSTVVVTWSPWSSSTSASARTTTSSARGGEFFLSSKTTTVSAAETSKTTTHSTTSAPTTTPSTTRPATPSTTASTTTSASGPVCSDNWVGSGSGSCKYTGNCALRASVTANTLFFERVSGEIVESLEACLAICDDNSECTAAIWTDDASANPADYKHCWQTKNLGAIYDAYSYAKIGFKSSCAGSSTSSYTKSG